jgi:alpha-galactosidase
MAARPLLLALLPTGALGLNNGLGRTPGLGWNSDYCIGCGAAGAQKVLRGYQNEAYVRSIADFIHSSGLAALGYAYVNMDASWDLPTRDANGDLQPDPAMWPSGLAATVDYVHSRGLGFGLYGDRGTLDCAKNPGQLGHEAQDAAFFARLKVRRLHPAMSCATLPPPFGARHHRQWLCSTLFAGS